MSNILIRLSSILPFHIPYVIGFLALIILLWIIYITYIWWVVLEGNIFDRKFVVSQKHVCITGGSEGNFLMYIKI
jgi:hypothetical protein